MSTLQPTATAARSVEVENIALPAGYSIEAVATGLNYPTSVAWDGEGNMLVAESTVPWGEAAPSEIRILRLREGGAREQVGPSFERLINDIAVHEGRLYVSHKGTISLVEDGRVRDLISGLPSWGLHENNALAFGPDGRLYFGQGTVSNAGVICTYTLERLRPAGHLSDCDTPGADVVLTGVNLPSTDMTTHETRVTGAYSPWGSATTRGQRIPGARPGQAANGAIMSADPEGTDLRVFAWGFRNPFGLAFGPDGRLYATNEGANRLPPRPISGDPDTLWRVEEGAWHGWPDYFAGQPATDPAFKPPNAPHNDLLIANHEELLRGRAMPPAPLVTFGLHAAPCKLDFCREPAFGYVGQAFVAEFGSLLTPLEHAGQQVQSGHRVVRVDLAQGTVSDVAANRSGKPASLGGGQGGLERPIQARFGPDGHLYVVDFGILELRPEGWVAPGGSGVIWRIRHGG